jgi:hypothetical protein
MKQSHLKSNKMKNIVYNKFLDNALSTLDERLDELENEVSKGKHEHLKKSVRYKVILETISEYYKKSKL